MWHHIRSKILAKFQKDTAVNRKLSVINVMVENGEITPGLASDYLIDIFFS